MKKLVLSLVMFMILLAGCGDDSVDLSEYALVDFYGVDTKGEATADLDYEKLIQDLYEVDYVWELSRQQEQEITDAFLSIEEVKVEPSRALSNGDEVEVIISVDRNTSEMFKNESKRSFNVEDLPEPNRITKEDIEDYISIEFNGLSGEAQIDNIHYSIYGAPTLTFESDKTNNLDNGDIITLTVDSASLERVHHSTYILEEDAKSFEYEVIGLTEPQVISFEDFTDSVQITASGLDTQGEITDAIVNLENFSYPLQLNLSNNGNLSNGDIIEFDLPSYMITELENAGYTIEGLKDSLTIEVTGLTEPSYITKEDFENAIDIQFDGLDTKGRIVESTIDMDLYSDDLWLDVPNDGQLSNNEIITFEIPNGVRSALERQGYLVHPSVEEISYEVTGLREATVLSKEDLLENLEFSFGGISDRGELEEVSQSFGSDFPQFTVTVENNGELSNGDTAVIRISDQTLSQLEKIDHAIMDDDRTLEVMVRGLRGFVASMDEIPNLDDFKRIIDEELERNANGFGYNGRAYSDYYYEFELDSYLYVSRPNDLMGSNSDLRSGGGILVGVYRVDGYHVEEEWYHDVHHFVVGLSNIIMDEDEKFNINDTRRFNVTFSSEYSRDQVIKYLEAHGYYFEDEDVETIDKGVMTEISSEMLEKYVYYHFVGNSGNGSLNIHRTIFPSTFSNFTMEVPENGSLSNGDVVRIQLSENDIDRLERNGVEFNEDDIYFEVEVEGLSNAPSSVDEIPNYDTLLDYVRQTIEAREELSLYDRNRGANRTHELEAILYRQFETESDSQQWGDSVVREGDGNLVLLYSVEHTIEADGVTNVERDYVAAFGFGGLIIDENGNVNIEHSDTTNIQFDFDGTHSLSTVLQMMKEYGYEEVDQ